MSYHSDTGAQISQAVGDYFERPPVATAFKDGIMNFRPQLDENYPGKLTSFQDGSLGSLAGPLFVNGEQFDAPLEIRHGGPSVPGGSVLGRGGETNGAQNGGGVLGSGASEGNGGTYPEAAPGPIDAYADGIVGTMPYTETMPGPHMAYRDGVMGANSLHRAAGRSQFSGLRGLGALLGLGSSPKIIDLRDPATLREVKQAMSFAVPDVAMTEAGVTVYDAAYYASPIWEPKASEILGTWLERYLAAMPGTPAAALVTIGEAGTYPTPIALMTMIAQSVGSPGTPGNPEFFQTNYPILSAFSRAAQAAEMDFSGFSVVPPYASEAARSAGGQGARLSTMALVGLGVVGALGAALIIHTTVKRKK